MISNLMNDMKSLEWFHYIIILVAALLTMHLMFLFGLFPLFPRKLKQFGLFWAHVLFCWSSVFYAPVVCQNNGVDVVSVTEKVIANDYKNGDSFGLTVSISGNLAIIGTGLRSGSAYIFERNVSNGSWTQQQKLVTNDSDVNDTVYFSGHGYRLGASISDDYAIVGLPGADDDTDNGAGDNSGVAYIFERNIVNGSWIQKQKLTPDDAAAGDNFGYSVDIDIDGDYGYAIVGAYRSDDIGYSSGSAYIFEKIVCDELDESDGQWIQKTKLTAYDAAGADFFGFDVSISGKYAIVGAFGDDQKGSAYIFERNDIDGTWNFTNKLVASDRNASARGRFGYAVSIFGHRAIVGADSDDGRNLTGSAYIFQRDSSGLWVQMQKVVAEDDSVGDRFGIDVSINERFTVVGAWRDSYAGFFRSGSVYVFEHDQLSGFWNQIRKLVAYDAALNGYFGSSVAISDENTVIIGAWGNESAYFDSLYTSTTYEQTNKSSLVPSFFLSSQPTFNLSNEPSYFPIKAPSDDSSMLASNAVETTQDTSATKQMMTSTKSTSPLVPIPSDSNNNADDTDKERVLFVVALCCFAVITVVACCGCYYFHARYHKSATDTKLIMREMSLGNASKSSSDISKWNSSDVRKWIHSILEQNLAIERSREEIILSFIKEFSKHHIDGKILLMLAQNEKELKQFQSRFSQDNQAAGIWFTFSRELKTLINTKSSVRVPNDPSFQIKFKFDIDPDRDLQKIPDLDKTRGVTNESQFSMSSSEGNMHTGTEGIDQETGEFYDQNTENQETETLTQGASVGNTSASIIL